MRIILRPRGRPEEEDVRVCRELRFSLAIMPPSKVCPLSQCQASVPLRCKCCQHVFQSKRKGEYSLSDQATKRMRVSKATKRASETSEQTLHRQLISGTTHAQFAEGLHFSAFHCLCNDVDREGSVQSNHPELM